MENRQNDLGLKLAGLMEKGKPLTLCSWVAKNMCDAILFDGKWINAHHRDAGLSQEIQGAIATYKNRVYKELCRDCTTYLSNVMRKLSGGNRAEG